MTTANKITISRMLLVPVFIVLVLYYVGTDIEWFRVWSILCFALMALGDGLDGYIARHYNQCSELGTVLDPLADKLLLISAVVILSLDSHSHFVRIPLWLTGIILGRDMLLVIGVAVLHYMAGKASVRPRFSGKLATVLQMATVLWILLQWDPGALSWLARLTAVFTGISGLFYLMDWIKQLSAHPSSAPSKI